MLLFGTETWVFSEEMFKNMEGVNVTFLNQMTGNKSNRNRDRTLRNAAVESALKEAGKHHATVAE